MARGGYRPGAGRPPNSKDKVKAAQQTQAEARETYIEKFGDDEWNKMTPLEVLLLGMKISLREGNMDKAIQRATLAATYCHPKLAAQTIDVNNVSNIENLPDHIIDQLLSQERDDNNPDGATH